MSRVQGWGVKGAGGEKATLQQTSWWWIVMLGTRAHGHTVVTTRSGVEQIVTYKSGQIPAKASFCRVDGWCPRSEGGFTLIATVSQREEGEGRVPLGKVGVEKVLLLLLAPGMERVDVHCAPRSWMPRRSSTCWTLAWSCGWPSGSRYKAWCWRSAAWG